MRATFTPFTTGNLTGSLTITSNAKNSPITIALSGTGVASSAHSVALSWNSSSSAVAGYNVYVSSSSRGPYSLLNSSPVPTTRLRRHQRASRRHLLFPYYFRKYLLSGERPFGIGSSFHPDN